MRLRFLINIFLIDISMSLKEALSYIINALLNELLMLVLLPSHTYSFCIPHGLFNIHTSCFEERFAVSMLVYENVILLRLIIIIIHLL